MHPILAAEAVTEHTLHLRENRRALRQMARKVVLWGATDDDTRFQSTLHDLSRRGLRIRSTTNIPCGQVITLDGEPGADLGAIQCRVVRVRVIDTEERPHFEYGLHLVEESRDHGYRWFLHFCYGSVTPVTQKALV